MNGTAPNLQLVGEVRSPARKVKLTRISRYSPTSGGSSFFHAHRKAQDEGSQIISIRTGVRLIHALSNPGAYTERKEVKRPKGMLISTPGLEMFIEGESKRNLPLLSDFAFWNGGLLVSSGGKRFGPQIVMGPTPWCKTRNVFQVPEELENASGISLIYEPGTWSFYEDGNEMLYLPKKNARPVWIPEAAGRFDLSVLDKGTDLSKEENASDITIFVFSRGMEWVGPTLCTLSPSDHRSIRVSAMVLPNQPMGAILETPWEGLED